MLKTKLATLFRGPLFPAWFSFFLIIASATCSHGAEADWVFTVQASATVQVSPPQITLSWEADELGAASYTIYRKSKTATSWGSPIASLPGSAGNYTDTDVTVGSTYEYQIAKVGIQGYSGYGYVYSGINAPLTESRGKLVLLVATNATASLGMELARLQSDLTGDGWQVIRHDVSSNDTPAHARSLVINDYNADPANVNAVFLFGHVPILQSGFVNYDGHGPRPMPSDGYYADMNGDWSSSPSALPSDVELMSGRVDLADMPGNGAPVRWPNETELLRNYLNKNHRWRFKQIIVPRRALIADRFGTFNGETRASTAYRSFEPFVGPGNTTLADVSDTAAPGQRWISLLSSGSYLWTYGNGGGQDTSISELGLHGEYNDVWSTDLYAQDARAVFFMLEGSHFGNWDRTDNVMRAVLAMPTMGLFVCTIAGHPQWYIHHMGLGEPIGFGARISMNNSTLYRDTTNLFSRAVYTALMGDPTLRMEPVAPPGPVSGNASSGVVNLSWGASPDGVIGYHVYRAPSPDGTFTRLTTALITGTSYSDTTSPAGNSTYMVRAVVLQVNPSGSYYNPSQGVFVTVNSSGAANAAPTISAIADQTLAENTSSTVIAITVGDADTAAGSLTLQGSSSNPDVIPDSGINFGGNGVHRTVTLTPAAGQSGSSTITVTVSDGAGSASTSFVLTVAPNSDTNGNPGFSLTSGTYNGLFYEADQIRQESSGSFTVTINPKGAYSGRLQQGTTRYSFKGQLTADGLGTNVLTRKGGPNLTLDLRVGSDEEADRIFGQVTDGSWIADLSGDRAVFNAKNHANRAGDYTLIIPSTNADASLPGGDGFATIRVTPTGQATLAGTLADGTTFSQSTSLSKNSTLPLYVPLYGGHGSLVSWLTFASRLDDDINGPISWIKPVTPKSHYYPAGFTNELMAVGSQYHHPPGTNSVLDLPTGQISFSGGNLASDFANAISIGRSSRVTNLGNNRLNVSFSTANGRFSGSVTDPNGGKPKSFSGVAFQKLNSGFGFLPGTNETSRVVIGP